MRHALDLASAAVIAVLAVLAIFTFAAYGITWDEPWHWAYGEHILAWLRSGGADRSALSYRADFLYGGAFDLLGAVVHRVAPTRWPAWQTHHLLGAMVGVWGVVGTWRFARWWGGPAAGLAATAMLATTPVYYGHMFNNPKDIPFAVGYVWATYALCVVAARLPSVRRRDWAVLALTAGLAMGVRIGGLLILCYLCALVAWVVWARARQTHSLRPALALAWRLGNASAAVAVGAWVVMLASWPWAQADPLRRPLVALSTMSHYLLHERTMPFAGQSMRTTDPRWDYLVHYMGLKLPLVVLVFAAVGLGLAIAAWRRHRRSGTAGWDGRGRAGAVLTLALVFPALYAVAARSVLYDGLRHFLFLVPLLCVVAGAAAAALPRALGRSPRLVAVVLWLAVVGMCGRTAVAMVRLHPHQYVYFNPLVGGLAGASGRYDTDYYGNAYKEGLEQLAERLWQTEPAHYLNHSYVLSGCLPDVIAYRYVEPGFEWRERDRFRRSTRTGKLRPEFYLGYTRSDCHIEHAEDPEFLRVQRDGALLIMVRDLRRETSPQPPTDPGHRSPHRGRRRGATWAKPTLPREPEPGGGT